ncbi:hypothetical protein N7474_007155 [Penicillium riverlandense]|uniref:uncharacterized protein n=1 Tax=Penicillium riverlandense TaxID=1903569 RepID=UPI002549A7CB|nr:uncharacterized protein N7474_007155 [Penicillium riverlandense]KAJ5815378.1 hypothetical protein N7474_007155 [Penicillium riverlandense]
MSGGVNKELVDLRRVETGQNLIENPSWSVGLRQKCITMVLSAVCAAGWTPVDSLDSSKDTKSSSSKDARNTPPTRALTVLIIPLWDPGCIASFQATARIGLPLGQPRSAPPMM